MSGYSCDILLVLSLLPTQFLDIVRSSKSNSSGLPWVWLTYVSSWASSLVWMWPNTVGLLQRTNPDTIQCTRSDVGTEGRLRNRVQSARPLRLKNRLVLSQQLSGLWIQDDNSVSITLSFQWAQDRYYNRKMAQTKWKESSSTLHQKGYFKIKIYACIFGIKILLFSNWFRELNMEHFKNVEEKQLRLIVFLKVREMHNICILKNIGKWIIVNCFSAE